MKEPIAWENDVGAYYIQKLNEEIEELKQEAVAPTYIPETETISYQER